MGTNVRNINDQDIFNTHLSVKFANSLWLIKDIASLSYTTDPIKAINIFEYTYVYLLYTPL